MNLSGIFDDKLAVRLICHDLSGLSQILKSVSDLTLYSEKQIVYYVNQEGLTYATPRFDFAIGNFRNTIHLIMWATERLTIRTSYLDKRLIYMLGQMPNLKTLTILDFEIEDQAAS